MATATERRAALATTLRDAVPAKWTVYPWRPVTEVLPCVTIEPRAPYQERGPAFRGRSLNLRLMALAAAVAGERSGDALEAVIDLLLPALDSAGIAWERVAAAGDATERAGVTSVGATIDLSPMDID